jgi:hypothetical protein
MIALIPLDNRPCNLRFPSQIAAIGGCELAAPPEETLGWFGTPGDPESVGRWLQQLPPVSALIVSIDMLAYGGLVASRHARVNEKTALQNLQALRDFRTAHPQTPIYAFNILMRLAVTMDSEEAVAHYYNVLRYARLVDEAEHFGSEYLRDQLHQVRSEIPEHILGEYLAARARNHAVNLRMLDWLDEGVFDYLLITQEDAAEFGLHRREQAKLIARVDELDLQNKMSLHPGADEAALTLLARHWKTGVQLRVHWSSKEDAARIAPFEDRPFDGSLAQHVASMHGVLQPAADEPLSTLEPGFELFVNAPVGGSQKDESETDRKARGLRLGSFIRAIDTAIKAGQNVALCDVAFPNGADDLLMTELEKRNLLGKLQVYGGWNTAGNTTGTVLAQCAALARVQDESGAIPPEAFALNRQFVFERLLDDWFYQAKVRARVEKSAYELKISPFNMHDEHTQVEAQARRELKGFARLLAQRQFGSTVKYCDISLPWHRTFEVDLRADLDGQAA